MSEPLRCQYAGCTEVAVHSVQLRRTGSATIENLTCEAHRVRIRDGMKRGRRNALIVVVALPPCGGTQMPLPLEVDPDGT